LTAAAVDPLPSRTVADLTAAALGLDAQRLEASPLLNFGGFVNRSFRVSDGHAAFFVKLSADEESKRGLQAWHRLHERLERDFRAPVMHDLMAVPGTPFAGAIFEWIDGRPAAPLSSPLLAEIEPLVHALHRDEELADVLDEVGGGIESCAMSYIVAYHQRFVEDLAYVAASPPPFVPAERLEWIAEEVDRLGRMVRGAAAFAEPADRPIHGDLWIDNVLVDERGRARIIDWDGLRLGDAMIDWAMLLGPTRAAVRPATRHTARLEQYWHASERARLELYERAALLDWILDPLADWVGADTAPAGATAVRPEKQRVHELAYDEHRSRYGE
jgi:Ser/Thr protein kinase RdoA (MazF antagonist)